jgi:hypothetical protein
MEPTTFCFDFEKENSSCDDSCVNGVLIGSRRIGCHHEQIKTVDFFLMRFGTGIE